MNERLYRDYRPLTPLLLVLLALSVWFATVCFVAAHELVSLKIMEIVAVTTVVLAAGHRVLR